MGVMSREGRSTTENENLRNAWLQNSVNAVAFLHSWKSKVYEFYQHSSTTWQLPYLDLVEGVIKILNIFRVDLEDARHLDKDVSDQLIHVPGTWQ